VKNDRKKCGLYAAQYGRKNDQLLFLYIAVDRFLKRTLALGRFLKHAISLDRFFIGGISSNVCGMGAVDGNLTRGVVAYPNVTNAGEKSLRNSQSVKHGS